MVVDLSSTVSINENYREIKPPKALDNPEFWIETFMPVKLGVGITFPYRELFVAAVHLREHGRSLHTGFFYTRYDPLPQMFRLSLGVTEVMGTVHQNYMATTRGLNP